MWRECVASWLARVPRPWRRSSNSGGPLRPRRVGIADVIAPPYDVIDAAQRGRARRALATQRRRARPAARPDGGDTYEHAAELLAQWTEEGVLVRDAEPTIWAWSRTTTRPAARGWTRRGFLARVAAPLRRRASGPHERTQPGPKEDRLRLTRATRHNLSPIFVLHAGDAWRHLEPALGGEPWGEVTDADGTVHRVWRVADPAVHAAIATELAGRRAADRRRPPPLRDRPHLRARGRAPAAPRRLHADGLVSLEDPGLTVFPTHRLLSGPPDEGKREALETR